MRRLLGVLRSSHEDGGLAPQPGIGDLAALADSVRASGLPVHLVIDPDPDLAELPVAVSMSAYRVVQEALTNILKHAGPAHAEVGISSSGGALIVEVTDDGTWNGVAHAGGHGLAGMRERAAIFGGELFAGPGLVAAGSCGPDFR